MAKAPATTSQAKQLSATSPETAALLLAVFAILIPIVFYFMFYSDLATKKASSTKRIENVKTEIAELKAQEAQLVEIRKEKERLESRLSILRSKIPSTPDELNHFLDSVNQRARSSRVDTWILFKQESQNSHGEYASLPIRMEFDATYEAAIQFFWDLATMGDGMKNNSREQIINIKEVEITRKDFKNPQIPVRVNCVAETYLYTGSASSDGSGKGKSKGKSKGKASKGGKK